MLIVSFDIATEKMFLVVEKDGKNIATHHEYSTPEKYNSALLIPSILKIFHNSHIKPSDVDIVAINSGPGSFTGIRAGAVIARTLGQFLDIPVVAVPSLEIYANALNSLKDKYVILDAKRSKWYTGIYSSDNTVIQEPTLKNNADVIEEIENTDYQIITEPVLQNTLEKFKPVLFTEIHNDFGLVLTALAKHKLSEVDDHKEYYKWYKLKPTYLQTPSISMPKKKNFVK